MFFAFIMCVDLYLHSSEELQTNNICGCDYGCLLCCYAWVKTTSMVQWENQCNSRLVI